jgi:hypothetical protein
MIYSQNIPSDFLFSSRQKNISEVFWVKNLNFSENNIVRFQYTKILSFSISYPDLIKFPYFADTTERGDRG